MSKLQEEILISVPIEAVRILEVAANLYRHSDTNPTLLDTLTIHIQQLDKLLAEAKAKVVSLVPAKPRTTGQSNNPEELWDAIEKMES